MRNTTFVLAVLIAGCGTQAQPSSTSAAVQPEDTPRNDADLTVIADTSNPANDLTCPSPTACFTVTSLKNITHIFIDVFPGTECAGEVDPVSVTVDGVTIPSSRFHTHGGPCNHGDDLISRTIWFPLIKLQKDAEVCVTSTGAAVDTISVGAKSSDECVAATTPSLGCECPPAPSPSPSPCPE